MIVLAGIAHFEADADFGIKGLETLCAKVSGSIKTQSVSAALKRHVGGNQIAGAAVFIRDGIGKTRPVVSCTYLQRERYAHGRTTAGGVKNVSGYAAQNSPEFLSSALARSSSTAPRPPAAFKVATACSGRALA